MSDDEPTTNELLRAAIRTLDADAEARVARSMAAKEPDSPTDHDAFNAAIRRLAPGYLPAREAVAALREERRVITEISPLPEQRTETSPSAERTKKWLRDAHRQTTERNRSRC